MKKAQTGDSLKRTRTGFRPGGSSYDKRGTRMKTDYSVDTAGYAAGKKRFPSSITVSEVNRPSKSATTKTTIGRKRLAS